jgi:hypothetical protein
MTLWCARLRRGRAPGHAEELGAVLLPLFPQRIFRLETEHRNHEVTKSTVQCASSPANGKRGFVDGQGAAARFNHPMGLAVDVDGSMLANDGDNHVLRRVIMTGAVSTVAGDGQRKGMPTVEAPPRASIEPPP